MRWTGIIVLLFLVFHLMDLTWGTANPRVRARRPVQQPRVQPAAAGRSRSSTSSRTIALGVPPVPRRLVDVPEHGHQQPALQQAAPPLRDRLRGAHPGRQPAASRSRCSCTVVELAVPAHRAHDRSRAHGGADAMALDSHDPRRPARTRSGTTTSSTSSSSTPRTSGASTSSSSAPASPARRPRRASAELGYNVKVVTFHDSPRRAHSIAAQGGINAAKNYKNDGDSVYRLFYDTIKGGDYRSREANVYRLAQVSVDIIDQCVAQGVPFAREYGGLLDNRSFGGAQVSRTFYARGQTGQQLLLGAYQALMRAGALGQRARSTRAPRCSTSSSRTARTAGIVCRDLEHRRGVLDVGPRGGARDRRLRQRLLPLDEREELERHRGVAGRRRRARTSPTPATRRSTRRASRRATSSSRSSR